MDLTELLILLATTTTAPPPAGGGGGLDPNLIQVLFLTMVVVGLGLAALFYAGSLLAGPWRRALSNTDRQAVVNAAMITGIALLVGGYTVVEPMRRQAAAERQLDASVHRGAALFGQYCVSCHGIAGGGGPVPPEAAKGQTAFAPPLANRADFRSDNPLELAQRGEYLRKVIERGKGVVMPAWSVNEGGALNSQDVENLVDFIQRGDWAEVRSRMPPEQVVSVQATAQALGGAVEADAPPGKQLFVSKGCVACHVVEGIPGGGAVGPNLSKKGAEPQIAGVLENNRDNMIKWLQNPPGVKPGTAMPNLGLNEDEAGKLSDYLLSLK